MGSLRAVILDPTDARRQPDDEHRWRVRRKNRIAGLIPSTMTVVLTERSP
jgi:hypothetical protein